MKGYCQSTQLPLLFHPLLKGRTCWKLDLADDPCPQASFTLLKSAEKKKPEWPMGPFSSLTVTLPCEASSTWKKGQQSWIQPANPGSKHTLNTCDQIKALLSKSQSQATLGNCWEDGDKSSCLSSQSQLRPDPIYAFNLSNQPCLTVSVWHIMTGGLKKAFKIYIITSSHQGVSN